MSTKSRISVAVDESVAINATKESIAKRIDELANKADQISSDDLHELANKVRSEAVIVS
ncbi:hypothetical protein [Vreelandella venusta]|uniref:hypothetical protein n=1 Tax=Vreelandella venusta TaxID=44935 RepID=UPI002010779C|nr:hypothetical protein [Halomonas venusta]UQI42720.1 hypothetical protein M3L73_10840 [Halomonas venusta]